MSFWLDVFQISTIFLQSLQQIFVFFHLNLHICHSWLTMLKITILISKDYDIDLYKISRYIAKTIVLLSPSRNKNMKVLDHYVLALEISLGHRINMFGHK